MKTMTEKAGLDAKNLTNHSRRKRVIQKLNDEGVRPTQTVQISKHKNVWTTTALCQNYNKNIFNFLSGYPRVLGPPGYQVGISSASSLNATKPVQRYFLLLLNLHCWWVIALICIQKLIEWKFSCYMQLTDIKLTSLPMCGFIAQMIEHHTGIAEVKGSNPIEALIFFRLLFSNCLNWKVTAMITLHFHLQPQYKYELFQINFRSCHYTGRYELNWIDLTPNVWLHSSVGRALHWYRGGNGFKSRWSPDFFSGFFFPIA